MWDDLMRNLAIILWVFVWSRLCEIVQDEVKRRIEEIYECAMSQRYNVYNKLGYAKAHLKNVIVLCTKGNGNLLCGDERVGEILIRKFMELLSMIYRSQIWSMYTHRKQKVDVHLGITSE
jgi:hypothetical protein